MTKPFKFFLPFLLLSIMTSAYPVQAATYVLDQEHTTVSFKIRHLISWVEGSFTEFQGSFVYDPENPGVWEAEAVIQAESIDTHVANRDKHLRSADFFDVEKYPTITFKSTGVAEVTPSNAKLNGLLTIHGVEKPVTLDVEIHGVAKDPWGNTLAGFTATTTVNRKDFGLNWNEVVETGQLLVGEEVKIQIEASGMLQE